MTQDVRAVVNEYKLPNALEELSKEVVCSAMSNEA